jgi:hypothetical protein
MPERQVCAQRHTFQLNCARNIETTLTTADRLTATGTSKDRDCTVSAFTVCVKDLRILSASTLFFPPTTCKLHFPEWNNIRLDSLHSVILCKHPNECQIVWLVTYNGNSTTQICAVVWYKLTYEAPLRNFNYTRNNTTFQVLSMQTTWNLSYHLLLRPTDGSLHILI